MNMNKSLEDKTVNVLVENLTEDKTQLFGRSEHMTSVIFNGKKSDIGKIVQVKVLSSNRNYLESTNVQFTKLQKNFLPLMCQMGGLPVNQHNLYLKKKYFKF